LILTDVKNNTNSWSVELSEKTPFYLIPFAMLLGVWYLASFYIFGLALFLFVIKLAEKKGLETNYFWLWSGILMWNIYIVIKSPVIYQGIIYSYHGYPLNDSISYYIGTIIVPLLIFYSFLNIKIDKKFLDYLFISFSICGIILGMSSIYYFALVGFDTTIRISGIWLNTNIVAIFYMFVFLFNLSGVINTNKYRLFRFVALFFSMFGIYLTQTRGVWLATIVAIIIYIIKRPKVILPAIIIIGIFIAAFSSTILAKFSSVTNFTTDLSTIGRLQAWFATIMLIKDNFLFGYGFEAFVYHQLDVVDIFFVFVPHSHNTFLRGIFEMGFIGFVMYFFFYFKALFYSFKSLSKEYKEDFKEYTDAFQLTFVGLSISFVFEPYFSLYGCSTVLIWVLISILFNLHKNYSA